MLFLIYLSYQSFLTFETFFPVLQFQILISNPCSGVEWFMWQKGHKGIWEKVQIKIITRWYLNC